MKLSILYIFIFLISFNHFSFGKDEKAKPIRLRGYVDESFESSLSAILSPFKKTLYVDVEFDIKTHKSSVSLLQKLKDDDADFIITDFPLSTSEKEELGGDIIFQAPLATGAVVLILHNENKENKMRDTDICEIITGDKFNIYAPSFESGIIWDLTTFLKRSGCDIEPTKKLDAKENIILKDSIEDIVKSVKNDPNSLGIIWYGYQKKLNTVSIWVNKSEKFVGPSKAGIIHNLMQVEDFYDANGWHDFTLTDMSKMPKDKSCASTPPYPICRYYFIIFKKDFNRIENKIISSMIRYVNFEGAGAIRFPDHITDISFFVSEYSNEELKKIINFSELNKIAKFVDPYAPTKKTNDHEVAHNQASSGTIFITSFLTLFSGIIVVGLYALFKRRNNNNSFFKNII